MDGGDLVAVNVLHLEQDRKTTTKQVLITQASAYNIGLYLAAADVSIPRGFSTTKNYLSIFRETNCHDLIVAICNHGK